MGAITPLGNSVEETWSALKEGKSGISAIDEFDVSAYSTRFGGLIKNFNVEDYMPLKEARRMDEFLHYGLAAGKQAIIDAGIQDAGYSPLRIGVAIGSGIGGITNIENTVELIKRQWPAQGIPVFCAGLHHQHDFRLTLH